MVSLWSGSGRRCRTRWYCSSRKPMLQSSVQFFTAMTGKSNWAKSGSRLPDSTTGIIPKNSISHVRWQSIPFPGGDNPNRCRVYPRKSSMGGFRPQVTSRLPMRHRRDTELASARVPYVLCAEKRNKRKKEKDQGTWMAV